MPPQWAGAPTPPSRTWPKPWTPMPPHNKLGPASHITPGGTMKHRPTWNSPRSGVHALARQAR
eukprot:7581059-Lingulodinium_polyedra.AAC.1